MCGADLTDYIEDDAKEEMEETGKKGRGRKTKPRIKGKSKTEC